MEMQKQSEENPFSIGGANEEADDEEQLIAQQLMNEVSEANAQQASVAGLVPLCIHLSSGPKIDPAIYGYDIAQMQERPWAKPGANLADYFNYGFDENSWRAYCAMQPQGSKSVLLSAEEFVHSQFGAAPQQHQQQQQPYPLMGSFADRREHRDVARPPMDRSMFKTRLCFAWREGNCPKGEHCNFAHGEVELRPMPGAAPNVGGGILEQPSMLPPLMPAPSKLPAPPQFVQPVASGFRMPPRRMLDQEPVFDAPPGQ